MSTIKDRAKRDSVFSWNDQSTNIRTNTWETGKKLNIETYEKKWKTVKSFIRGKKSAQSRKAKMPVLPSQYVRHLRYSLDMETADQVDEDMNEEKRQIARELTLKKFKKVVTKVLLLRSVFIHVLKYAMEKGGHEKITSDPRLRLKVDHAQLRFDKENDKVFDPEIFKTDYQGYFPKWAKEITLKVPGDRTSDEVNSLARILSRLKEFRRYTPQIQRLLCKAIRYDRFERHRVIIRKNHVGRRFYIIFSGTVAFTLSKEDCEVFSKPTEYYKLGKGDAFGELALIRNVRRSATIVCLQTTEFLYIEKEDFHEMGIDNILRKEMEIRVKFLREFDLFSTWPHQVLQKVAEESRSMEYRNDLVIDNNFLQSDMLHIVIKGRCEVLRLLDLTQSKKWVKLRRNQKKLCNSEFPETKSSAPYSRQGANSRFSAISNVISYERRIPRTLSQPQPRRTTTRTEHVPPRLVKSAHCTVAQRRENVVKEKSHPGSSKSRENRSCNNAFSKMESSAMESEQNQVGLGVFLSLDVIEKGQSAGLQGVLRTDEDMLPDSNIDRRHLALISKGCFILSIPVETVKKHADYTTIKKIQKRVKAYPSDDALVDCYLEKSKWNAYKEVLMGRMIKDIEKRRYEQKPGSMVPGTAAVTQVHSEHAISRTRQTTRRPGTRQRMRYVRPESRAEPRPESRAEFSPQFRSESRPQSRSQSRPQSMISHLESIPESAEHKLPRRLCSTSPATHKPNPEKGSYPYKHSATIFAQGSHRDLVLVNGRIRTNATQEKIEEKLLNRCMEVY